MIEKVIVMYNSSNKEVEETLKLLKENGVDYDEYVGFSPAARLRRDKNYVESFGEEIDGREVKVVVVHKNRVLWHNYRPDIITEFHSLNNSGKFDS